MSRTSAEVFQPIDHLRSKEDMQDLISENPVFLISADLPGCGSTSLTRGLAEGIESQYDTIAHEVHIGKALREALNVTNEEELQSRLSEVGDPKVFDPQFYGDLPEDQPCIIDGKLATTAGPQYITEGRPIVKIDLTSHPLISAKRVLQRERYPLQEILSADQGESILLDRLSMMKRRASHDNNLRGTLESSDDLQDNTFHYQIDTSKFAINEIIGFFTGETNFDNEVPKWETRALKDTLATFAHLNVTLDGKTHPNDASHFEHHFESIKYNMERLDVMKHPAGIAEIRSDLKKSISDCWFGLMMKEAPRFFADSNGETILDADSHSWTPEFYKIAEGWPVLSSLLKDKEILDPFAGAGTLINLLVARGIPKAAAMSDIAYSGGKPLNEEGHTYLPALNNQVSQLLFDNLPSWYKPDFTPIKGYFTASADQLPIKDDAIDYVVADPPYGRNCKTGGLDLLLHSLDEFNRISREGSVLMTPVDWVEEIKAAGHSVTPLTGDVSRGHSKLPVCYILVDNKKEMNYER